VLGLIDAVKKGVREALGVILEEEVELWGFDGHQV
jgi:UDP-N-acetylenolpyruvoylglucosamine reductase